MNFLLANTTILSVVYIFLSSSIIRLKGSERSINQELGCVWGVFAEEVPQYQKTLQFMTDLLFALERLYLQNKFPSKRPRVEPLPH